MDENTFSNFGNDSFVVREAGTFTWTKFSSYNNADYFCYIVSSYQVESVYFVAYNNSAWSVRKITTTAV